MLDALVGKDASESTKDSFRKKLRDGDFNDKEIEPDVQDNANPFAKMFDIPDMPGASVSMMSMSDMFGKGMGDKTKRKKMTVEDSYDILMAEEADKLLDEDKVVQDALDLVQQNGIVFIDEVDKIAVNQNTRGGDVQPGRGAT